MARKIIISLAVTACLLAIGAGLVLHGPQAGEAPASALLKPITSQELLATIRALNSPLVLVNFWASWCEPCKQEFPSILALREKLAAQGLKVIFVSIDEPRDFQAAEDFLHEHHVDFQTYYKG